MTFKPVARYSNLKAMMIDACMSLLTVFDYMYHVASYIDRQSL